MSDPVLLRLDSYLEAWGGDSPEGPLSEQEMLAEIKSQAIEKVASGEIYYDGDDVSDLLLWLRERGLDDCEATDLASAIIDELHESLRWEWVDYYHDRRELA
jgi:hypothetical protein